MRFSNPLTPYAPQSLIRSATPTNPFGNYLCQKLLEYSTDDQRNVICESVTQNLVTISLNMHGTRAVQKMIDFLSTRMQVSVLCFYRRSPAAR